MEQIEINGKKYRQATNPDYVLPINCDYPLILKASLYNDAPVQEGKHTPGAIRFIEKQSGTKIYFSVQPVGSPYVIAELWCLKSYTEEEIQKTKANAARIVECWNGWDVLKEHHAKLALKATGYEIKCEKLQEENTRLHSLILDNVYSIWKGCDSGLPFKEWKQKFLQGHNL